MRYIYFIDKQPLQMKIHLTDFERSKDEVKY